MDVVILEFEDRNARQRKWYAAHREEIAERRQHYREANADKIHEQYLERYNRASTKRLRDKTLRKILKRERIP